MVKRTQQGGSYLDSSEGSLHRHEKDTTLEGKTSSAPTYPDAYDNQTGEVHDPYGGKKLGMLRVCISHTLL